MDPFTPVHPDAPGGAPVDGAATLSMGRRRAVPVLGVVLFGTLVVPFDTMVNAAFPAITAAFGLDVASIRWIVICYMLALSSVIIVGGRLGDLFGHRRMFGLGLALLTAALAVCGIATSYDGLLAARVVQGLGAAIVLASGPPLALLASPESARTRVLSLYGAAFALTLALGPLLGGTLVDAFGWRATYLARVPIAAAGLLLLATVDAPQQRDGRSFDFVGAILLAAWTGALLLAVALGGLAGAMLGGVAVAAFAAFTVREATRPEPMIRLALFRHAAFTVPNLASVAAHFSAFSIFLLGPYLFVNTLGLSAQGAGLLLGLGPAASALGAALVGRLATAIGARRVALLGLLLDLAGVIAAAGWDATSSPVAIGAWLALQGFGLGLFHVAYTDIVLAALPPEERGVATSLTQLSRTLGVVSSAAVVSVLFGSAQSRALAAGAEPAAAFVQGYGFALTSVSIGFAAFLALSALRPRVWAAR